MVSRLGVRKEFVLVFSGRAAVILQPTCLSGDASAGCRVTGLGVSG